MAAGCAPARNHALARKKQGGTCGAKHTGVCVCVQACVSGGSGGTDFGGDHEVVVRDLREEEVVRDVSVRDVVVQGVDAVAKLAVHRLEGGKDKTPVAVVVHHRLVAVVLQVRLCVHMRAFKRHSNGGSSLKYVVYCVHACVCACEGVRRQEMARNMVSGVTGVACDVGVAYHADEPPATERQRADVVVPAHPRRNAQHAI